ncbi:MAG: aminotransferase class V-fold PLP-dependent enzyme, partial [Bacteroidota bacterium]
VQSADGFEIDLERVTQWCKAYDCTLVLDGTQGLGAIPFRVDPSVSMVFLSSSFKWLLAGYGVAIGYVSQDLLPRFKAFQGWNSIDAGQQIL